MEFRNPENDYVETGTTGMSWLWAFLWPPLYYAVKGVWTHAIASFLLAWVVGALTFGIATFVIGMVYAIMNRNIVRNHYLGKGWSEVAEG